MYLLAESGNRFYDGNFRWGAQILLFLLFAVSTRGLIRYVLDENGKTLNKLLLGILYASHFLAGLAYTIHCFLSTSYA